MYIFSGIVFTGRSIIRTIIRTNQARRLTLRESIENYNNFNDNDWEDYYTEIIDLQVEKAGNAGQETLLGDDYFRKYAKEYCERLSEDYNDDGFIVHMRSSLGNDYFNAISEIIEECSLELAEGHNAAFDINTFDMYNPNTVYGNYSNALSVYQARAFNRYGAYGSKAHLAAKRKTITTFLKNNPNGIPRNQPGSPAAGRSRAESLAVSRRTIQRFLAANPNGTRRVP